MAADVHVNAGNAAYQITYPTPDASAPDAIASKIPDVVVLAEEINIAVAMMINGIVPTKFQVVSATGLLELFPRREYTAHARPDAVINIALGREGELTPGSTR